jgi:hypothetical protein
LRGGGGHNRVKVKKKDSVTNKSRASAENMHRD